MVFSYRYRPQKGYLFNQKFTISSFKKHVSKKAESKRCKFIVSCDISNFYDRLNLHRLENVLLSIGCDGKYVKLINHTLIAMANRDSYGLSVGSNASRILAEAALIPIDDFLCASGIDFVRFVDDYRLFTRDAESAHYALTLLIERLDQEGLSVNTAKTKIEPKDTFFGKQKGANKSEIQSVDSVKKSRDIEIKNPFIIRAGYGGAIPMKFRAPSMNIQKILQDIKLDEKVMMLQKSDAIDPEDIMQVIKACIVQEKFDKFIEILLILPKYLQVCPYYVDAVVKNYAQFTESQRGEIQSFFRSMLLNKEYLPEYLTVNCITLLSHPSFKDVTALLSYYKEMRKNQSIWVGRTVLDGVFELIEKYTDRSKVLELRSGYQRSDLWERRQIIRIVQKVLPEDESRPWIMNLRNLERSDDFLSELLQTTQDPKKRKKKKNVIPQ